MQEQVEQEVASVENSLEVALKLLWEKAYAASNTINALREEKNALQLQTNELESRVAQMQAEAAAKSEEIGKLRSEIEQMLLASASNGILNKDDRVQLQEKVRMILNRINSHL